MGASGFGGISSILAVSKGSSSSSECRGEWMVVIACGFQLLLKISPSKVSKELALKAAALVGDGRLVGQPRLTLFRTNVGVR